MTALLDDAELAARTQAILTEPVLRYRRPTTLPAWCEDCLADLVPAEQAVGLCHHCKTARDSAPAYLPAEMEQSEEWRILRSYIRALAAASPAAIVRVVTADRLAMWTAAEFHDADGARCLVGHAEDWWRDCEGAMMWTDKAALTLRCERAQSPIVYAFDELDRRFGLSILVPAVRQEASRYV